MTGVSWKHITFVWSNFFWRYALFMVALLLLGGVLLNWIKDFLFAPKFLFFAAWFYGGGLSILVSAGLFRYFFERRFRHSSLIIIPARQNCRQAWLKGWFAYFWRFLLFSFAFAFCVGMLAPFIAIALGFPPMSVLKYTKYIGIISTIPASFGAFALVFRRKKRVLDINTVRIEQIVS